MKHATFLFIFSVLLLNNVSSNELERVNDEELEKLIANERFVVVLFRTRDCSDCDTAESILLAVREDLVDSLNAWVIKAESSSVAANFTTGGTINTPHIVFFRQGIPLLYDGPLSEEVILDSFIQNQEEVVKSLNDDTFEHLTQAASGATTGDWFIMFYRDDCEACLKFQAKWEYVASQLKGRTNLAKVNIMLDGISTASRFKVEKVPFFLFFRLGKYYIYDIPNLESKALQDFASGWYKNAKSETVPSPSTPFDELVDQVVFTLKENPLILPTACVLLLIAALLVGLNALQARTAVKSKAKKKKSK